MKKLWILPVILVLSAASVFAEESYDAKVSRIEGVVLAHQGELYQTAREGMLLNEGDRLMVMEAAELKLTYNDGCVFTFKGGQVIEISKVSTCEGAQAFVKTTTPMYVDIAPGASVTESSSSSTVAEWMVPAVTLGIVVLNEAQDPASP